MTMRDMFDEMAREDNKKLPSYALAKKLTEKELASLCGLFSKATEEELFALDKYLCVWLNKYK